MHTKYFSNFLTNIFGYCSRSYLLIPVYLLKKPPQPHRIITYFHKTGNQDEQIRI
jgi:hypothetical protein